ncbi:acylphosphatase [Methanofollis fontis]|uniref:acylphosphatase n=1 Tax=Methanofollis fontis TaxID=2052832 RepID=A0A483CVA4_9EURY|nr:acylphosphatase [Methanofollis fontis]TAJ45421.1 acylphosphatase [Methanofollis fontis]
MTVRVHVFVSGRVQGVCYRYAVEDEAGRLGVAGWVQNLPDGRVEAVFEGDEEAVNAMLVFCRQGSRGARVDGIEEMQENPLGESGFSIRS